MELSPRDIVARNMVREMEKGGGFEGGHFHLDLRPASSIMEIRKRVARKRRSDGS